jgi:hypothetical protein
MGWTKGTLHYDNVLNLYATDETSPLDVVYLS